jgi:hypothetical protein
VKHLGVLHVSPAVRRLASVLMGALLVLVVAGPAFGYNEENVKHIRITRLDPLVCATPIRLVADLTDKAGNAVPGATVVWSFKKSETGDSLNPTTTSSDSEGRARTVLTLACKKGVRQILAHVPGDGSDRITIVCKSDTSCTKKDEGEENEHGENSHRDDDVLVAPVGRNAGTGMGTPSGTAGSGSASSGPTLGSFSQYIAVLLSVMVTLMGIGLAQGRPRGFVLTRLRSRATA